MKAFKGLGSTIPPSVSDLLNELYKKSESPVKAAVVSTGGGAGLGGWMIGTPGASSAVLDLQTPYLQSALASYMGGHPAKYCEARTASDMATMALQQAKDLWMKQNGGCTASLIGKTFVGLSATASLVTTRPKCGEHRAYVSAATDKGVRTYSLIMGKGARDRSGEDSLVSLLMVKALCEASDTASQALDREFVGGPDRLSETFAASEDPFNALLREDSQERRVRTVLVVPTKGQTTSAVLFPNYRPQVPTLVYCGSFNPLHRGHLDLANTAQRQLKGLPLVFEISAANADKPGIDRHDLDERLIQFSKSKLPIVVTRAPLFTEKVRAPAF